MKRQCFCCDKELELDYDDEIEASSNYVGATCWTSYGAWCSQVFDGMFDKYLKLELVICDECLKKKIETTYGWKRIDIMGEPISIKEGGRKIPVLKKQECGEFERYTK